MKTSLTSFLIAVVLPLVCQGEISPFTIVVMPDTQNYVLEYPRGLANQTEWIRKNRDTLNLKMVIHEGDVVQNPSLREEWEIATAAFEHLDGVVPYLFTLGNHDMDVGKRDKTLYREFFPLSRFERMPTYAGSQNAHADNTFHTFEVGHLKFLIIAVEYSPDDACLHWANDIIAKHPQHRVIVNTHSYLNANERNDQGKIIWDKCIRKHPNIFLVTCGHLTAGRRVARGDHGNVVHELLANYQDYDNGGNGWLRLLRFHPSSNRIEVKTYSSLFNRYMAEGDPKGSRLTDHHFELPYLMDWAASELPAPLVFEAVPETAAPRGLYREFEIEGWPILLHPNLEDGHPDLCQDVLDLLSEQLAAVAKALPARAVQELREVPIWIEHDHPLHEGICYHPDATWLRENGMNPEKVGAVEISKAQNFVDLSESQPFLILHGLAHAYHFRRVGGNDESIRKAYELAAANKRYQKVAHVSGEERRHDALNNDKEYFAEATKAYFGKNDFYPFNRSDLIVHDPDIASLVPYHWGETVLEARLLESRKIWDASPHNAFTSLVSWKGKLVCAFRESKTHADSVGTIRILASKDRGKSWAPTAFLRQEGIDLRDPKLSVSPKNELLVVMGQQTKEGDKRVTNSAISTSKDGHTWSIPKQVGKDGRWLWGIHWHQEIAYGVAYPTPEGAPFSSLVKSTNGLDFDTIIPQFSGPGRPTEAALATDKEGHPWCLHRYDSNPSFALLGHANDMESPWQWKTLDRRIGGPSLTQLPSGHWIVVVRLYDQSPRTEVCHIDPESGRIIPLLRLPSGGDTSYAGLVYQKDVLHISYYASHEGKAAIYFAKVAISELP